MMRLVLLTVLLPGLLASGAGCARNGPIAAVQAEHDAPRAGQVYLLRGFWGAAFSRGIDEIGDRLDMHGVHAVVFNGGQTRRLAQAIADAAAVAEDPEPLVLIGHSHGADNAIRIASALAEAGVTVDLLITIDPTTPPPVPGNVRQVWNVYQSNGFWDTFPWFRGIPLRSSDQDVELVNLDLRQDGRELLERRTSHFNIDNNPKVQSVLVARVLEICRPRSQWLAERDQAARLAEDRE